MSNAGLKEMSAMHKRHSPAFLAVFAVFLIATTICAAGTMLGIARGKLEFHDTRWFWASGRLLAHRANPYDEQAVRRMQASASIHKIGNDVVRNPPPALFLIAPLGMLSPREAVRAWALLLAACLALSFVTMWAILRESPDLCCDRWYLILILCFAPAIDCVGVGQTGVVILLGLALFLRFCDRNPFWAGAALSLCTLKPHLLLPFGSALLVWIVVRRRWAVLAGAVAALAAESVVAMLLDPAVWAHYAAGMRTQGIEALYVPTIGVALRFFFDKKAMWIEFVPAAAGCAWGLWYFWRNRKHWDWRTHGSLLTLISLVVAPYSWFTDQVIALPAILFALTAEKPLRRGSLTLLLAIMSAGAIEMMVTSTLYFKPYLLDCVAWLGWYVYAVSARAEQDEILQTTVAP